MFFVFAFIVAFVCFLYIAYKGSDMERYGKETEATVIQCLPSTSMLRCHDCYVQFTDEKGQKRIVALDNVPKELRVGQIIKIKYLPNKYSVLFLYVII